MFFKKKEEKPLITHFNSKELFQTEEFWANKMNRHQYYESNSDYYTMLKQDGKFLGYPLPNGGKIYPFSPDPEQKGSRREKNSYRHAQVTIIRKDLNIHVDWGTGPDELRYIEDPNTKEAYSMGLGGYFVVTINPNDAARNATEFYRKILQGEESGYDVDTLKERLVSESIVEIGAEVARAVIERKRSLANGIVLTDDDILNVSENAFEHIKNCFASYGLTITKFQVNRMNLTKMQ